MKLKELLKFVNVYTPEIILLERDFFEIAYKKPYSSEPNFERIGDLEVDSILEISVTSIVIRVKKFN